MPLPSSARLFGPLSLLALAASACAAPAEGGHASISSLAAPIQDGQAARGQPNVVGLQGIVAREANGTLRTLLCTGSLIAPNLVLTARHCIARVASSEVTCGKAGFNAPLSPRDVFVTTEDEMPDNLSRYLETREILVPDEGNDVCGFDVALVILRNNVPANVASPLEPRLESVVGADESYRAVGFGATSGEADGESASGVRRERTGLKASCIEGGGSDCPLSSGSEWEGQAGVCEGDSGGPALDDDGRVIGVASRSVFGEEGECLTPVYGAVAGWRDWLREQGARAAELGNYEPAAWVTSTGGGNTNGGGGQPTGGSGAGGGAGGGKGNASTASDDGGDDGCAVRSPGGAGGGALWVFGAALALAGRRRRRG